MISVVGGTPVGKIVDSSEYPAERGRHRYVGIMEEKLAGDIPGFEPNYNSGSFNEKVISKELGTQNVKKILKEKARRIKYEKEMREMPPGDSFEIETGRIIPIPNIEKNRTIYYLSGPSGAGKSTLTADIVNEYMNIYPENRVHIFSTVTSDKAFSSFDRTSASPVQLEERGEEHYSRCTRHILDFKTMGAMQADMWKFNALQKKLKKNVASQGSALYDGILEEAEVLDDKMKDGMKKFRNSMVVFDDIDTIVSKDMREAVSMFRSRILKTGRHDNISACCTSHTLCGGTDTKDMINEADCIIIFIRNILKRQVEYLLKESMGVGRESVNKLLELPVRWVLVTRDSPRYAMYPQGVMFMK